MSKFWPLLKWASFFEAAGVVAKIGLSLKPNHYMQFSLPESAKRSVRLTYGFNLTYRSRVWRLILHRTIWNIMCGIMQEIWAGAMGLFSTWRYWDLLNIILFNVLMNWFAILIYLVFVLSLIKISSFDPRSNNYCFKLAFVIRKWYH